MNAVEFACLLVAVLAAGAVIGVQICAALDVLLDRDTPQSSVLSDASAGGSTDGTRPAPLDPPIRGGARFPQFPQ